MPDATTDDNVLWTHRDHSLDGVSLRRSAITGRLYLTLDGASTAVHLSIAAVTTLITALTAAMELPELHRGFGAMITALIHGSRRRLVLADPSSSTPWRIHPADISPGIPGWLAGSALTDVIDLRTASQASSAGDLDEASDPSEFVAALYDIDTAVVETPRPVPALDRRGLPAERYAVVRATIPTYPEAPGFRGTFIRRDGTASMPWYGGADDASADSWQWWSSGDLTDVRVVSEGESS